MSEERRHLELPDRRENTYASLEKRVEECFEELGDRISRWLTRGLIIVSIIGSACTVALVGFGILLGQLRDTRKDFTRAVCESQNARHRDTISTFNTAKKDAIKKHPEQKQAINENVEANLKIIDALVPIQNCEYLVKLSVGDATPTPPAKTP